jgi:lactate 2-monooxygenase
MSFVVSGDVAHLTKASVKPPANPVEYENTIYQKCLQFERPPFSFQTRKLESEAEQRMSAESKGYIVGNAGTGEMTCKNQEAFVKWSIVPRRLVTTSSLPNIRTKVFDKEGICAIYVSVFCGISSIILIKKPCRMSTASSTSIEDVAKANGDGVRWY